MAYRITYTKRFRKHYEKMTQTEKKQIRTKVKMLSENPRHPSLRTKRIQGTDDLFECSVNMDIRIIWYYEAVSSVPVAACFAYPASCLR